MRLQGNEREAGGKSKQRGLGGRLPPGNCDERVFAGLLWRGHPCELWRQYPGRAG